MHIYALPDKVHCCNYRQNKDHFPHSILMGHLDATTETIKPCRIERLW